MYFPSKQPLLSFLFEKYDEEWADFLFVLSIAGDVKVCIICFVNVALMLHGNAV